MALLNECYFRAVDRGAGAFVAASAMPGYYTPAQCLGPPPVDGAPYDYRAEIDNLAQRETGRGIYTAATGTLTRDTIYQSSNAGAKVDFAFPPTVRIAALKQTFDEFQPLDADLTAIAGLETDGFGLALLTKTTAAAVQAYIGVREVLTANRTYYVRTDGNDSHTGLADSSAGALLTFNQAIFLARVLDLNGHTVTLLAGSESGTKTFTANMVIGGITGNGNLVISGNGSGSTIFTSASGDTLSLSNCGQTLVSLKACKLQSAGYGVKVNYQSLFTIGTDVNFGAMGGAAIWVHDTQAICQILSTAFTISGNMDSFFFVQYGHVFFEGNTVTLTGTPVWATGFIVTFPRGSLQVIGNTHSGSSTGKRYNIFYQSVLNLNAGAEATELPGGTAGSKDATSVVI